MPENFKNFIAGEGIAPASGAYFENRNPADWSDVIGCFPRSGSDDVRRAVESAKRGFAQWSKTPAPLRDQEVLNRLILLVGLLFVLRCQLAGLNLALQRGFGQFFIAGA